MAPRSISPIRHRIDARARVPASKSLANRELLLSALAEGASEVVLGPLDPGDDVRAMHAALVALGHEAEARSDGSIRVTGRRGAGSSTVSAGAAGTVARFVTALAATRPGPTTIDGSERMRERPMAALARALRDLGARVDGERLPLTLSGPLRGGSTDVPGHESSQFASALLLVGARSAEGVTVRVSGSVVSAPFLEMTVAALEQRGVRVERPAPHTYRVAPQRVRGRRAVIPGDATAGTYPAAAAAILGGAVRIENVALERGPGRQGDLRCFDVLREMGCSVSTLFGGITLRRDGPLFGIRENVRDISDTFPTLAVVAACAEGESELVGVGHTRRQESDRVAAVANGLRALGGDVTEYADGIRIRPVPLHGGVVDAAGDHRIAMAFAILGLFVPGVWVEGAGSVSKTFPGFFDMVRELGH